jgi:hypothetical protein
LTAGTKRELPLLNPMRIGLRRAEVLSITIAAIVRKDMHERRAWLEGVINHSFIFGN